MLAIGRMLMTNPRVLLLDEPFEGLAPVIEELETTFRKLRAEGLATILVEQRTEDALRLSDRAIALEGAASDLLADFARAQSHISVETGIRRCRQFSRPPRDRRLAARRCDSVAPRLRRAPFRCDREDHGGGDFGSLAAADIEPTSAFNSAKARRR